jgi:hypothetical protein
MAESVPKLYTPQTSQVRMSDTGFWVVEIEVAPGQRVGVMIGGQARTEEEAIMLAFGGLPATGIPYQATDQGG